MGLESGSNYIVDGERYGGIDGCGYITCNGYGTGNCWDCGFSNGTGTGTVYLNNYGGGFGDGDGFGDGAGYMDGQGGGGE